MIIGFLEIPAVEDFFEDLDVFGIPFIASLSNPASLAAVLENIDKYPANVELGGKPGSADPFIYAALLYAQINEARRAQEVLEKGELEYACANDDVRWRVERYLTFREKKRQILEELGG